GVAVGELQALVHSAEFWADRSGGGHGGINVQPDIVLAADGANVVERVKGTRGGRTRRGAHETGYQACSLVLFKLSGKHIGSHGEVLVNFDQAKIRSADPGNFHGLFYRGVSLA